MKTIELNYPPGVAVEYLRNWVAVLDKNKEATIEQKAKLDGRSMTMLLIPKKEK